MCFKRHHSFPIVFLTSPRGRIRHVVFICSSHRDTYSVHHFTLAPFFAFSLICLSYINQSFVMKWVTLFPARNCYELPSSWNGVTSFPMKTLNWHISRTRHTRISVFALNGDLVTSILNTKKFHPGKLCVSGLYLCRLIQQRSHGEEGNCSYLIPLSRRDTDNALWHTCSLTGSCSLPMVWDRATRLSL